MAGNPSAGSGGGSEPVGSRSGMTSLRLKYIHRFRDRYGLVRHYFRRPGQPSVSLPGLPGSAEFMAAYQTALAIVPTPPAGGASGSFNALATSWYRSGDFSALSAASKVTYRRIVEAFLAQHGEKPVALIEARHIRDLLDGMVDTPAQANKLRSILRLMLRHAVERGWRQDNPAEQVRKVRYNKKGFAAWTNVDLAAYETRWPVGTRERLAFELLLMTGQRRGDVIRMGPRDIHDGGIEVKQGKTGTPLLVPIGPELQAAIDACLLVGTGTFLITQYGKPFASGTAFYNWFRDKSRAAGVDKPPHGLRKANQRIIAEQGGTTKQAMAVSGHLTMSEAERYQRSAHQPTLARAGIEALSKDENGTPSGKLRSEFSQTFETQPHTYKLRL